MSPFPTSVGLSCFYFRLRCILLRQACTFSCYHYELSRRKCTKQNVIARKISDTVFSPSSAIPIDIMLLTVEIKIFIRWFTFCDMKVIPKFYENLRFGLNFVVRGEGPLWEAGYINKLSFLLKVSESCWIIQVWEPVKCGELSRYLFLICDYVKMCFSVKVL
jgi:hypothetical protein